MHPTYHQPRLHPARRTRGIALVIVLGFIVLLTFLLVAFMSSVGTERTAADLYSNGVSVKHLSEVATNLVTSQIVDATKTWEVTPTLNPATGLEDPGPGNQRLTWASQPGAIHTFNDKPYSASNRRHRTFRLYSSDKLVVPGTESLLDKIPTDWPQMRALYADLNAPVLVSANPDDPQDPIAKGGRHYYANYPIVDPLALGRVEGFEMDPAPGFRGSGSGATIPASWDPTSPAPAGKTSNPVPMPVRWIYLLRDGRLTVPPSAKDNGTIADWSTAPAGVVKPSKTNPIVGRIAFWTDDETSKLNINTASEGICWERPWQGSGASDTPYSENSMVNRVPMKGEYQRYPGHPATVCLSTVLGGLSPAMRIPWFKQTWSSSDYDSLLKPYYNLVPRVGDGGTRGGTVDSSIPGSTPPKVTLDGDRLYATVDELLYAPDPQNGKRRLNSAVVTNFALDRRHLEQSRFFLTAHARAAEVNMFNLPRICLWPLQAETNYRTAREQLIALCTTVGGKPFHLQRQSVYTKSVQSWLASGGTVPSSQSPGLDWKVTRNQDIFRYLQNMTDTPVPAWGQVFKDKWKPIEKPSRTRSQIRDDVALSMLDMIRMGVNTYNLDPDQSPIYHYTAAREPNYIHSGAGQVVPLEPPGITSRGFGRFPTVTEAAFVFYRTVKPGGSPTKGPFYMRLMVILEPFTPAVGSWGYNPLVRYEIEGLDQIKVKDKSGALRSGLFQKKLQNYVTSRVSSLGIAAFTGTVDSFQYFGDATNDKQKQVLENTLGAYDPEKNYPFVSDYIEIDPNARIQFDGTAPLTLRIYSGYSKATPDPSDLVQTIRIKFPRALTLPATRVPSDTSMLNMNTRLANVAANVIQAVGTGGDGYDVVRSLEADWRPGGEVHGDLRVLASAREVPDTWFAFWPDDHPATEDDQIVHSLRNEGPLLPGGNNANPSLLPTINWAGQTQRGTNGAFIDNGRTILGDWDNGPRNAILDLPAGCYINKPDDFYGSTDDIRKNTATPNRQIAAANSFGGLLAGQPFRTLLLSPHPVAGKLHPSNPENPANYPNKQVPDHLVFDLFTMPVVEPYAISEPLSTAGRINLNYRIAPFSYLRRKTGLYGIFKSTQLGIISVNRSGVPGTSGTGQLRAPVDPKETLNCIDQWLDNPDHSGVFRSASEIAEVHMVPQGQTAASIESYWNSEALSPSGDDVREYPYGNVYARLTTKSNTYTVHLRVQTLRQVSQRSDYAIWDESKDQLAGEYRGSTIIERYVDTSDPDLAKKDFATDFKQSLDRHYKFRVVGTRRFAP